MEGDYLDNRSGRPYNPSTTLRLFVVRKLKNNLLDTELAFIYYCLNHIGIIIFIIIIFI